MPEIALHALATVWLLGCAACDLRSRKVPNLLTLPVMAVCLGIRCLAIFQQGAFVPDEFLPLLIGIVAVFLAWQKGLVGGADLKITLALAFLNPWLVASAWGGVIVYFLGLVIFLRNKPLRFAGVPGFAIGIALLTILEVLVTMGFRIGTS
jgi:Flp pilus assembly protein protease CpaA